MKHAVDAPITDAPISIRMFRRSVRDLPLSQESRLASSAQRHAQRLLHAESDWGPHRPRRGSAGRECILYSIAYKYLGTCTCNGLLAWRPPSGGCLRVELRPAGASSECVRGAGCKCNIRIRTCNGNPTRIDTCLSASLDSLVPTRPARAMASQSWTNSRRRCVQWHAAPLASSFARPPAMFPLLFGATYTVPPSCSHAHSSPRCRWPLRGRRSITMLSWSKSPPPSPSHPPRRRWPHQHHHCRRCQPRV